MTVTMTVGIKGIGWITDQSMGSPEHFYRYKSPGKLPKLRRKNVLGHPYQPFGRMESFSKLGFSAVAFALADAGISTEGQKDISLIASTTSGCLETDIKFWHHTQSGKPSPTTFAYTLDSTFLGDAATCFNLTGETLVVNESGCSGLAGLFMAMDLLASKGCDAILCGICNSNLSSHGNPMPDSCRPGALFLVLDRTDHPAYGSIRAVSIQEIYYNDCSTVSNLYDLARQCCGHEF